METETDVCVNDLAERARAVARADSPALVFKALLEGCRAVVPRAAVYLVRRGEIGGWGSVGHPTGVARSQRSFRAPANHGWLGEVIRRTDEAPCARPTGLHQPDFGQAEAAEAVACAIRMDGRPIALVVGERNPGEEPWLSEGLALLVSVTQLRLEVNLARRRTAATEEEAAASSTAEAPEPQPSAEIEVARRYARLVATDIRLYNEEAVMLGRRNGDLAERLGEHLDRGKETFVRRHGDLGPSGIELLHEAYVQVLAAGDPALLPAGLLE